MGRNGFWGWGCAGWERVWGGVVGVSGCRKAVPPHDRLLETRGSQELGSCPAKGRQVRPEST